MYQFMPVAYFSKKLNAYCDLTLNWKKIPVCFRVYIVFYPYRTHIDRKIYDNELFINYTYIYNY